MNFQEYQYIIPQNNSISLIPPKDIEHFSQDDYSQIQKDIQNLNTMNKEIEDKIKNRSENISYIKENMSKYETFYKMYADTQEKNNSYYKMMLFLVTFIFIVILLVVSYFVYFQRR